MQDPSTAADQEAQSAPIFAERGKHDATVSLSLHLGFAMLLYIIIVFTFPIDDLSSTHNGLLRLVYDDVTYNHSNGESGSLRTVQDLSDVVAYTESLVGHLLSDVSDERGRHLHGQYALLGAHRLVSSVAIVQRRVAHGNCSTIKDCAGRELTFGQQHLTNGLELPYSPGLQGFAVELPLHAKQASDMLVELKDGHYWDTSTRDVALLFGLHNGPGQYLGRVRIDFSLLPSGQLSRERVDMDFFKLRPYDDPVQGCVLIGLQIWAGLHWLLLFGLLCRRLLLQPHVRWRLAVLFEPWTLFELGGHFCVACGLCAWFVYIQDPRRENIQVTAARFENILALAGEFQRSIVFLSWAVAFWTVRMVQFLQELQKRRDRIAAAIIESVFEGVMFFFLLVGVMPRVGDFWSVLDMMAMWFATVSDGREDLVDMTGGPALFLFFILVCLMVLVNMFALIVSEAQERQSQKGKETSSLRAETEVEDRNRSKSWNCRLADVICDMLGVATYLDDSADNEEIPQDGPKRFEQLLHEIGWVDARG